MRATMDNVQQYTEEKGAECRKLGALNQRPVQACTAVIIFEIVYMCTIMHYQIGYCLPGTYVQVYCN